MSKLSLLEIAQSQLDTTPVVDGQLIVCLDTGNAYRDNSVAHVKIGNDLEVVSELPLAPLAEKLYYLKPDKLYSNIGGNQVLLNNRVVIQDNLTSDSSTDSLSAKQGKVLKNLIDKKPDEMKLYPITIPAEGWKSDSSISYPYYIDIQISGIKESDCIAVTISPEDIDVAKAAYFTTTEAKNNVLRLRARKIPTKQISASYYFIREDILMAFGPVSIGGSSYVLPPATADTLGGVMIGDGLAVDETGKAAFAPAAMTTPTAKALGTKLAGEGLTVDENGKINLNETGALTSYPVGSIYQSTSSTSPAALFGGSWQEIAQNRVLMGASYTHAAGTTVEAGLPNITGSFVANVRMNRHAVSGAFTAGNNLATTGADNSDASVYKFSLDASKSNAIYGRSSTVQPAAYYVHIWRRVA